MLAIKSIFIFLLAGLCEIGGGYLVWQYLKNDKPVWTGVVGMMILALYGIAAAMQPAGFGRTYATYGGFFIVMSLLWAWKFDGFRPDRYDIIGSIVALIGVFIIFFAPRK